MPEVAALMTPASSIADQEVSVLLLAVALSALDAVSPLPQAANVKPNKAVKPPNKNFFFLTIR